MFARLQKELQTFLIQYNISVETDIFDNVLTKILDIEDENGRLGIQKYDSDEKNKYCTFHLPPVTPEKFTQILDFFEIPANERKINLQLRVSEKILFEKILNEFKTYVSSHINDADGTLESYVIESKPILEGMAIQQVKNAADTIVNELNKIDNYGVVNTETKELSCQLFLLLGVLDQLRENNHHYNYVLDVVSSLNKIFKHYPFLYIQKDVIRLKHNFDLLYDGLDNYKKYTRAESAIAAVKFMSESQRYLESIGINSTNCDIVEHTLLQMAGINNIPKKCHFGIGDDRTRITFRIDGMNKEDANKFVNFFKELGDKTAQEGWGWRRRINYIPKAEVIEVDTLECMQEKSSLSFIPQSASFYQKPVERHNFEVDAKIFYEVVYPKFKQQIELLKNNSSLDFQFYLDKVAAALTSAELAKLEDEVNKDTSGLIDEFAEKLRVTISTTRNLLEAGQKYALRYLDPKYSSGVFDAYTDLKKAAENDLVTNPDTSLGKQYLLAITKLSQYYLQISPNKEESFKKIHKLDVGNQSFFSKKSDKMEMESMESTQHEFKTQGRKKHHHK